VRWTIYALIAAEESWAITSANVDAMKGSTSAEVRRFLGVDTDSAGGSSQRRLDAARDQAGRQLRRDLRASPRG